MYSMMISSGRPRFHALTFFFCTNTTIINSPWPSPFMLVYWLLMLDCTRALRAEIQVVGERSDERYFRNKENEFSINKCRVFTKLLVSTCPCCSCLGTSDSLYGLMHMSVVVHGYFTMTERLQEPKQIYHGCQTLWICLEQLCILPLRLGVEFPLINTVSSRFLLLKVDLPHSGVDLPLSPSLSLSRSHWESNNLQPDNGNKMSFSDSE